MRRGNSVAHSQGTNVPRQGIDHCHRYHQQQQQQQQRRNNGYLLRPILVAFFLVGSVPVFFAYRKRMIALSSSSLSSSSSSPPPSSASTPSSVSSLLDDNENDRIASTTTSSSTTKKQAPLEATVRETDETIPPLDFAMVSLRSFQHVDPVVSALSCFARRNGILYYTEYDNSTTSRISLQHKLDLVRRHLTSHSWVLYVDADTQLGGGKNHSETLEKLQQFVSQMQADDYHVALTEASNGDGGGVGLNPAAFWVKQSEIGFQFVSLATAFLSDKENNMTNDDSDSLNLHFLHQALGTRYSGSCDDFLGGEQGKDDEEEEMSDNNSNNKALFLECFYRVLGQESSSTEISAAARQQFPTFRVVGWNELGSFYSPSLEDDSEAIFHGGKKDNDQDVVLDDKNNCGTFPIYIHIPKTGGEAIEAALGSHKIGMGHRADWRPRVAPYRLSNIGNVPEHQKYHYCNFWHRPPLQYEPFSVVVVRDPLERLLSEFCYAMDLMEKWYDTTVSMDCQGLNDFSTVALAQYEEEAGAILDCHLLPQWHFAQMAEIVLPFHALQNQTWRTISRLFGIPHEALPKDNVARSGCKEAISLEADCLTPENRRRWEDHFAQDYQYLSQCFSQDNMDEYSLNFGCQVHQTGWS